MYYLAIANHVQQIPAFDVIEGIGSQQWRPRRMENTSSLFDGHLPLPPFHPVLPRPNSRVTFYNSIRPNRPGWPGSRPLRNRQTPKNLRHHPRQLQKGFVVVERPPDCAQTGRHRTCWVSSECWQCRGLQCRCRWLRRHAHHFSLSHRHWCISSLPRNTLSPAAVSQTMGVQAVPVMVLLSLLLPVMLVVLHVEVTSSLANEWKHLQSGLALGLWHLILHMCNATAFPASTKTKSMSGYVLWRRRGGSKRGVCRDRRKVLGRRRRRGRTYWGQTNTRTAKALAKQRRSRWQTDDGGFSGRSRRRSLAVVPTTIGQKFRSFQDQLGFQGELPSRSSSKGVLIFSSVVGFQLCMCYGIYFCPSPRWVTCLRPQQGLTTHARTPDNRSVTNLRRRWHSRVKGTKVIQGGFRHQ